MDADIDTVRLDFTWQADSEGVELVMADDRWAPMYHFTQADVDSGRVYAQHYSGSENTVVIWVSDGLHFITDSLVVRASEPFVRACNGTELTVVALQCAVVSAANVGFSTNIDVDLADIIFQVKRVLRIAVLALIIHTFIRTFPDLNIIFNHSSSIDLRPSVCLSAANSFPKLKVRYRKLFQKMAEHSQNSFQQKKNVKDDAIFNSGVLCGTCLLYTSPSPRD